MIAFSKFVELNRELNRSCSEVEKHIDKVLEYDLEKTAGSIVDFGVDGREEFTIFCLDHINNSNLESAIDEKDYLTMMKITSKDELLSFLSDRLI